MSSESDDDKISSDISKLNSIKIDSKKSSIQEDSKESKHSSKTKGEKSSKETKTVKETKSIKVTKTVKETKSVKESKGKETKSKKESKSGEAEDIKETKEEAPKETPEKEIREKEISDLCKMLLKKNFEGRRFFEEKIKKWSQAVLDEMWSYLIEKYPQYGFGILTFITEELDFYTAGQAIFNRDLDSKIIEIYKNASMSVVIVVFFIKRRKRQIEVLYIDPEHFFNINRIFGNGFEKREWNNKVQRYCENVANDINTYIIKDYTLGKSFLQGFALKNDYIRVHANFKFGNLEFLPYITSYSNDQFIAYLFIFFVNN